ncbi:MAG: toprim domain-containing protein [Thermoplasmatota archaeon]
MASPAGSPAGGERFSTPTGAEGASLSRQERLERLEGLLEELRAASLQAPVLVEGERDAAALIELRVLGRLLSLNRGQSIVRRCEELARSYDRVILLTDWDRKGRQLREKLRRGLEACGAVADDRIWVALRRQCAGGCRTVEDLPSLLRSLRETARRPDPGRA